MPDQTLALTRTDGYSAVPGQGLIGDPGMRDRWTRRSRWAHRRGSIAAPCRKAGYAELGIRLTAREGDGRSHNCLAELGTIAATGHRILAVAPEVISFAGAGIMHAVTSGPRPIEILEKLTNPTLLTAGYKVC